ncbi:MAG: hypothetical protein JW982_02515 [Spirochaetes bacterium]|nr:hypothetical protein [Spirochaetota bacterium]
MKTRNLSRKERKLFWQQHVENFRKSGQTAKSYCIDNNLSYWSFNDWKKRFLKENKSKAIVEIPHSPFDSISHFEDKFEIVGSGSLRISIPDNFEPEVLIKIIKTLRKM